TVPILCEPAVSAGELIVSIGGQVRGVDSLAMAAGMLDTDPTETLVVIGPETETNEALAFAAHLRLAPPGGPPPAAARGRCHGDCSPSPLPIMRRPLRTAGSSPYSRLRAAAARPRCRSTWAWRSPGEPVSECASWTWTSRSATWR